MPEDPRLQLIGREVFLVSLMGEARGLQSIMHRLAARMDELSLREGDLLYRQGERAEDYFFVVSGEVCLTRPGALPISVGEKNVVGGLDATLARPHTQEARAAKPTHLLVLHARDWAELLEDNFALARHVVAHVAGIVHQLRMRPPPLGGWSEPAGSDRSDRPALHVIDRILHLRQVPTFARAGIQTLAALAQLGSTAVASEGEELFAPGEAPRQLVVVASGRLRVSWPDSPLVASFGPHSLVGGGGALSGAKVLGIRAERPTRAIVLPVEDYFDVMEEHFDLVRAAMVGLGEEREALTDRR